MVFIKQFIELFTSLKLTESVLKDLFGILTSKKYKKGDIIIEAGLQSRSFYIVKSGVVRGYYIDKKGKSYTQQLSTKFNITGSFDSLIKKQISKTTHDCLTNCELFIGNYDDFIKLSEKNHTVSLLYNRILELVFLIRERRIRSLTMYDATERYLMLLKDIPYIEDLIPQYHIAAYLNITNVQLSRIRKNLSIKKMGGGGGK